MLAGVFGFRNAKPKVEVEALEQLVAVKVALDHPEAWYRLFPNLKGHSTVQIANDKNDNRRMAAASVTVAYVAPTVFNLKKSAVNWYSTKRPLSSSSSEGGW